MIKNKFYQFMQGRYGNDQLNIFLIVCGLVSTLLLTLFVPNKFFYLRSIGTVFYIVAVVRMLSKNRSKRYNENVKFMNWAKPWIGFFYKKVNQKKDKEHKYFNCPQCHRTLRVPSDRGKIEISCPHCGRKFKKRT